MATQLAIHFAADFADIFEVRGMKRKNRGTDLPPDATRERVVLGYRGLDGVERRTLLQFEPEPSRLTASTARLDRTLRPQQEVLLTVTVACQRGRTPPTVPGFEEARVEVQANLER